MASFWGGWVNHHRLAGFHSLIVLCTCLFFHFLLQLALGILGGLVKAYRHFIFSIFLLPVPRFLTGDSCAGDVMLPQQDRVF